MEVSKKTIKIIEDIIKELFSKMGIKCSLKSSFSDYTNNSKSLIINVELDDPKNVIGQQGLNLRAFQHLVRLLVRKKIKEPVNFTIDVNEYKKNKEVYLKELARSVAEEVIRDNKLIVLKPMPAYDRRIVHLELAKNDFVETESLGEEPERRIVVKPKQESGEKRNRK